MTSPHPSPGDLLDLHFGEARGGRRARIEAHAAACSRCREELQDVEWLERSLAALPEQAPPADGLERVMSRIADGRPAHASRSDWVRALGATLAGVASGAGAIYATGSRLASSTPTASGSLLEAVGAVSGFGLAAAAFFAFGSLVTLALAPALLIEAQARPHARTAR